MQIKRSSGVLLHPTSLPGKYGVGELGDKARDFIDQLADSGQSWWQMLPLNPTDSGGSPYSSPSAFAMNPALISLDELVEHDLLKAEEAAEIEDLADGFADDEFEVESILPARLELLQVAAQRFNPEHVWFSEFEAYQRQEAAWLRDYALFMALKNEQGGRGWVEWPGELKAREKKALDAAQDRLKSEILAQEVLQFLVARQWANLRTYAADRGVKFIGDIPIFVAFDSADVWANRQAFDVEADGSATHVAGVPPDYFSKTGQKWGNPLYDWEALKKTDYAWWIARIQRSMDAFDLVRIDHFRGFESFWAVPFHAPTAETGEWRQCPGDDFFAVVKRVLGEVPFIAEDLGVITDRVEALRDKNQLPGMKVLQFAFDGNPNHSFLPHTYPTHCVAYTGTHDNDTSRGWYESESEEVRHRVRSYFSHPDDGIVYAMIDRLMASKAELVVFPLQDVLNLPTEARMNTPGTNHSNWRWRVRDAQLSDSKPWQKLTEMTKNYER